MIEDKVREKIAKYLQYQRELLDRQITYFHFSRAIRKINKCINLARKYKQPFFYYYFSSQVHIINDDFKAAISCLNKALILRPDDGCCYNDKALCLVELGKMDLAFNNFNQGIKREPDCASLYQNKGWLLHLHGRYKEAILCFHKAFEIDPDRIEAIFSLADTYQKLEDLTRARHYFLKVKLLLKHKCAVVYKETLLRLQQLAVSK